MHVSGLVVAWILPVLGVGLRPPGAVSRRNALSVGLVSIVPSKATAVAEWACALNKDEFTIKKRQESSVRIRPETMLLASSAKRDVKLLKVPLGRSALTSFDPDEQIDLSRFFQSRAEAERLTAKRVADIYANSLRRQADRPDSPLKSVAVDADSAVVETRKGRRYVSLDYVTDGCRKIDEDGACVGQAKRAAVVVMTVSLESQARTLEEQRRMDEGELEARYIDTLWLFQVSELLGAGNKKSPSTPGPDLFRSLRDVATCFEVLD